MGTKEAESCDSPGKRELKLVVNVAPGVGIVLCPFFVFDGFNGAYVEF